MGVRDRWSHMLFRFPYEPTRVSQSMRAQTRGEDLTCTTVVASRFRAAKSLFRVSMSWRSLDYSVVASSPFRLHE